MNKVIFDESNINWDSDPRYVNAFLKGVQVVIDGLFEHRGFVTLLDIYNYLGAPYTEDQCVELASTIWSKKRNDKAVNLSDIVEVKGFA